MNVLAQDIAQNSLKLIINASENSCYDNTHDLLWWVVHLLVNVVTAIQLCGLARYTGGSVPVFAYIGQTLLCYGITLSMGHAYSSLCIQFIITMDDCNAVNHECTSTNCSSN